MPKSSSLSEKLPDENEKIFVVVGGVKLSKSGKAYNLKLETAKLPLDLQYIYLSIPKDEINTIDEISEKTNIEYVGKIRFYPMSVKK